ncbi:MAG: galactose-1-phosphate uridylyltransferase [Planctomycetaceae bacterium]|nr:galactose-1-phosphate uridylyltransferase [Planctomycetaceae bacterium]
MPEPTQPSVPERRYDPVSGRWVVIAGNRADRPHDLPTEIDPPQLESCSFCAGRESETTEPVAVWASEGSASHDHEWQVRVVPNLYPAFVASEPLISDSPAIADQHSIGLHDVVIESPRHQRRMTELTLAESEIVFQAYRSRLQDYAKDPAIVYGFFFKNCGRAAGMSREHIHSQMVGLPFVPPVVQTELDHSERFFQKTGRCIFCDLIQRERDAGLRIVAESDQLIALCPYASRFSYETWILPKKHLSFFEQTANDLLRELTELVHKVLFCLEQELNQPAYNYLLHTNPFDTCQKDHYHWHIEIIPRVARLAGLEWGTGIHINSVSPEVAAANLRKLTR